MMEFLALIGGVLGLVAFVRLEKLIKALKDKGVLDKDYKGE